MRTLLAAIVVTVVVGIAGCSDGAATDPRCNACRPDQICVAYHDGTCSGAMVECQDRNPTCADTDCTQGGDCEFWHCKLGMDAGVPYVCYACPDDVPGALNCHGP